MTPGATRGDPSTLDAPGGGGWPGAAGFRGWACPSAAFVGPPPSPRPSDGWRRVPLARCWDVALGSAPRGAGSRTDVLGHPVRTVVPDPGTPDHTAQQALVVPEWGVTGGRKHAPALSSLHLFMNSAHGPVATAWGCSWGRGPRKPPTRLLKIIGLPQGKESMFSFSLAGKCELFSCCHGNQDKFSTSFRYLVLRAL